MVAKIQQVKCGQADVTPCATCGKKTHGWWVQCESCESWHHFTCAGVDESVRSKNWLCTSCSTDAAAVSTIRDDSNMAQMMDLQKQFLDLVQAERESVKAEREIQQQFLCMVQAEREAVKAERELQKEQIDLQKQQMELQRHQLEEQRLFMENTMKVLKNSRGDSVPQPSISNLMSDDSADVSRNISVKLFDDGTAEILTNLTKAMNQSQQRDLMIFSGNPMAWPSWIADYKITSKEGQFSDIQNVNRLRKALKDNARAAVQPQLNVGTDANAIINILESIYGRAEDLLNKEASELLKLAAITHKYDEKLPAFNIKLKNYVLMAKNQKNDAALNQPYILSELHNKFLSSPGHYDKIASMHDDNPDFNLEDLSNYLDNSVRKMPQQILLKCNFAKFMPSTKGTKQTLSHEAVKEPVCDNPKSITNKVAFRCPQCSSIHPMWKCQQFKELAWSKKFDLLRRNEVCFKCLNSKAHKANDCNLKGSCRVEGCSGQHNTVMHRPNEASHPSEELTNEESRRQCSMDSPQHYTPPSAQNAKLQLSHADNETMLFQIAPIKLYGQDGAIKTYAMLDPASSLSMMERSVYDQLQLDGVDDTLNLKWTGGVTKNESCKRVSLVISSAKGGHLHKLNNVYVRESLALAPQNFNVDEMKRRYKHLRGLKLESFDDAVPTVMIGLEHANFLAGSKTISGKPDEPIAMKTKLGWIVYGKSGMKIDTAAHNNSYHRVTTVVSYHHTRIVDDDESIAQEEVKKYFSTEGFGIVPTKTLVSDADKIAIDIMTSTLKKVGDRYEIGLLWKDVNAKLSDSLPMAMRRLKSEEKSLKTRNLLEWKNQEMQSLISKGYARIATPEDMLTHWSRTWTAPTFVVVNENKHPPKPRNVMDAAAEFNGVSLNKMLLKGPDNMAPLFAALFRLRQHRIAINADVKEMFSQILIKPEDQQCQRIIWRNGSTTQEPTLMIFQRMMFGTVCSPSCAQFVKNHHANLYMDKYPKAAEVLINSTYVDDLFTSEPTVEKAFDVISNAIKICKEMSFDLVSVQSNSMELLERLPAEHIKRNLVGFDSESDTYITKVLGMHWKPMTDNFIFVFKERESILATDVQPTKRRVLSTLMKIFDPLGIICKYTLSGKLVLQDIWRSGIDWDQPISSDLKEAWSNFIIMIGHIASHQIPRHYSPGMPADSKITMVIFADASEVAFAAVAYFRFESEDGEVHVSLVMAKSKVAPIKPLSIPQLELQAAVLGVRMASTIQKLHTLNISNVLFLSDSSCVLMWINSKAMKFKSFVAVRIGEILESTTQNQWYHVGTHDNVADEATRPISTITGENERWYQGPDFLRNPIEKWPISRVVNDSSFCLMVHHTVPPEQSFEATKGIGARFKSDWARYCRVIAWMLRFADASRKRVHKKLNFITPVERERAEDLLFKMIQFEAYPEELHDLKESGRVASSSKLIGFSPFLGNDGVIRMSSRAQRASISYAARNPAILPNKHPLTDIFIMFHHCRNLHMREETIIADTRSRGWIVNVRSAVRRVSINCQQCKNRRAKPVHPRMGLLPEERLHFGEKAFTFVGTDCFGPFLVKQGRNSVKRYGIIFTCLVYRAVYLELLTDLSLEQVILALRSLKARRGPVKMIFSDNGTNFVGAKNQLSKDAKETMDKFGKAASDLLDIEWRFIPAYSPWMGGAWERLIASIKNSLEFTLQGERPSEDTLKGALIQAELDMNRRPLTHSPIDHEDDEPLTPNHALFGNNGYASQAIGEIDEKDKFASSKIRQARHLGEKFRRRWIKEYLPTITRRSKWFKDVRPIQLNDIVVLVDPDNPRHEWKKGRVVSLHPGPDNIVRTVDIMLADGTLKIRRSVGRVAVLDIRRPDDLSSNY